MALPLTTDKLEDLPEVVREHYVERNGKWTLETDVDPRLVTARKESGEERRKRQELERENQAMKQQVEELKQRRQKEEGDEETASQRYQRLRAEADEAKRKADEDLRERDSQIQRLRTELTKERIGARIRNEAQRAGLIQQAIDDAVSAGMGVFREDESSKLAAFDGGNERLFGRNGEDLTIAEWLTDRRVDKPHWFGAAQNGAGNQGGGAAHQGGGAPARPRPKNRSEMTAAEKAAAISDLGIEGFMALPA